MKSIKFVTKSRILVSSALILCISGMILPACQTQMVTLPAVQGRPLYGVDVSNNLVRFGSQSPDVITNSFAISGLYDGETILGIEVTYDVVFGPVRAAFDFVGGGMKRLCFEVIDFDGCVVSIVEEPEDFRLYLLSGKKSPLFARSGTFHFQLLLARSRFGGAQSRVCSVWS